jgi:crotonobetainyl-CoA:carnitine CoA-transferase CaiB-like acyl-CoA transferase
MLETLVGADSVTYPSVLNGGREHGNPRPGMVVHGIGGRYLAMQIVGGTDLWQRMLGLLQRPELASDPRFASTEARSRHWPELRAIITGWLDGFASVEAALQALEAARVPCAPVLRPAEVIASEHLAQRAFFPTLQHAVVGPVRVTASPYHLDGHPVHPRGPAPHLPGDDTRAVLGELLGYEDERIAALLRSGAVAES